MEKLVNLLNDNNIISLTFYELEGLCKFIKCFAKESNSYFFLRISSSYELKIPQTFHITRLKSRGKIPVVDNSSEYTPIILEKMPIQEAYPQIYFSKDSARFKRIYEQMRRIGGCFQRLEARPVIEDGELLCEMQVDFSLAWFESEGSAMPLNWYTIYPLEVFYDKRATFASCILRIEENLGKIFEETRSLNIEFALNARVSRLIRKGRESLDKSKKLLDVAKIQSERRLREYSTLEKKLKEKMADFKGREDNEAIVAASSLEKQARTLQQLSLKEMANLQETTSALKTMQLKSDEIYYQLACAINSLVLSDC